MPGGCGPGAGRWEASCVESQRRNDGARCTAPRSLPDAMFQQTNQPTIHPRYDCLQFPIALIAPRMSGRPCVPLAATAAPPPRPPCPALSDKEPTHAHTIECIPLTCLPILLHYKSIKAAHRDNSPW